MSWIDESLRWYLTSLAAAVAFAPLAAWLFSRLPGHGAWFARPVGMLATVWPVWFLASVSPIPYATWLLWAVLIAGGAVGWGLAVRVKAIDRHWVQSMVTAELVFLVAFAVGIAFRGYVPKIAGTEQPMDVGFLASSIRATDMPPRDEWFAGEPINYYYLGYLINGSIARMSGLPSWVAYNLALIGTFATTVVVTAGLARAIACRLVDRSLATLAAVAGAFLIAIAGNMRAPIEFLKDPGFVWNTFWFQNIGWQSSRVIVDTGWPQAETITEFPSFSFILGDLHPHVTTLPFTVLTLAIAVSLFLRVRDGWRSDDWRGWAELGVAGIAVGALYPMNSWDFPTYAGAIAVAVIAVYGIGRATIEQGLALGTVSILAWSPFWLGFVPFAGDDTVNVPNIPGYRQFAENVGGYNGPWTTAGEYLTVFGLLWAIAMLYLGIETFAPRTSEAEDQVVGVEAEGPDHADGTVRAVRGGLITLGVIAALVAIALPAPVVLLSGIPVALAIRLIARRWHEGVNAETVVLALLAAGFGITLQTEFFYVRDTFHGRYNTLFKVYYQVWTLLGIGCAVAVARLWQRAARSPAFRVVMMAGLVAALALGSAYPIISGKTLFDYKNEERDWRGLDGLKEHGEAETATNVEPILRGRSPDDVAAIRWLNDHARQGDVLLEAPGCIYQRNSELPTSRFSAFTGIPTVIGWDGSEDQWRGGQPELRGQIADRAGDVSSMYEEPDPTTNPLFDQYGITLLIVGDYERYGAGADCEKAGPYEAVSQEGYPGPAWVLEFEAGETRIYRRATS